MSRMDPRIHQVLDGELSREALRNVPASRLHLHPHTIVRDRGSSANPAARTVPAPSRAVPYHERYREP